MSLPRIPGYRRLRVSRRMAAVVAGFALAILALYQVSLAPPGLHRRPLQVAAASTTVLVDTRQPTSTDLGTRANGLQALTTQANLVGEAMVTNPALAQIGRLAGINPLDIQATAPVTSSVPRVEVEPGSGANAMSLVQAPDHYKLQIQADPTMPVLHIYTQAPSAAEAVRLANATVQGTRDYLAQLSVSQQVSLRNQVKLDQLGAATGGAVDGHAAFEIALLAFFTGSLGLLFVTALTTRIQAGWTSSRTPTQASR